MGKVHFNEIDILKGIAILLVIMGHSFTDHPIDVKGGIPELLNNIVIVVQMPLFFLASGFLFKTEIEWGLLFKKKLTRILIPYATFCILTILLRTVFAPFTNSGAPSPSEAVVRFFTGGYFWFLYSLFIMMVVCRFLRNRWSLFLLLIISMAAMLLFEDIKPVILQKSLHYIFFFVAGIFYRDNYTKFRLKSTLSNWVVGIFLVATYFVVETPSLNICEIPFVKCYISPIIGCLGTWYLCIALSHLSYPFPVLKHFGQYSLQYYLNHLLTILACYYFAKFVGLTSMIASWIVIVLSAIAISWIMLMVEKRLTITKKMCGLN